MKPIIFLAGLLVGIVAAVAIPAYAGTSQEESLVRIARALEGLERKEIRVTCEAKR